MYRAGIAFYHLGDYECALRYLRDAKNREPTGENNCGTIVHVLFVGTTGDTFNMMMDIL